MKLLDIVSILTGKQTHNLKCVANAVDGLCFSLVAQRTSLDLEAASEIERDCLVKGFTICLNAAKKKWSRK